MPVPAQAHTNPDEGITNDEGVTSSKSKYDALNILKNIHEAAVQELFYNWDMEKLLPLIQGTFDFIAGVNDDKKWSEYDLMYEWTDFTHFYTSAFYTRSNYFSVECSKEALIDE